MFSLLITLFSVSVVSIVRPIVSFTSHVSRSLQPRKSVPVFNFDGRMLIIVEDTYTDTDNNLDKSIDDFKKLFPRMSISSVHILEGISLSDVIKHHPSDYVVVLRYKMVRDTKWLMFLTMMLLRSHASVVPLSEDIQVPHYCGSREISVRTIDVSKQYNIQVFDTDWAVLCTTPSLVHKSCRDMFHERYKVLCYPFIE